MINPFELFIFTECYNCGKIANPCLRSFRKFHVERVHIFCTEQDRKELDEDIITDPNFIFIDTREDHQLKRLYKLGHRGSGHIFAKVIEQQRYGANFIHFDSDVIFLQESLSLIHEEFRKGSDIVGSRRSYKYNRSDRNDLRSQPDTIACHFFGLNASKISMWDFTLLSAMAAGHASPHAMHILDTFDPVIYDAYLNGAKASFLDVDEVGGMNELGSKANACGVLNEKMDAGKRLLHFAGIGSGRSVYMKKSNPPKAYADWALGRYATFSRIFFNEDIGLPVDEELCDLLKIIL